MTAGPLVVTTSLPSMLIFTRSIKTQLECWNHGILEYCASPHHSTIPLFRSSILNRAFLLCDMRFKLITKFFYKCSRGHGCRIAEGTDRVAHDIAAYVEDQIKIAGFPFTILDAMKNLFHPVATLAAR